jgi:hypothetical protein
MEPKSPTINLACPMPDINSIPLPIYPETARFEASRDLGTTNFACDLSVCHGACCTMPAEAGAPILEGEIAELERVFPEVKKYLSDDSVATIEKHGIWQREMDGNYTIPAIRGRDCVFVMYDEDQPPPAPSLKSRGKIAYCAIERAYRNGDIEGFPKPISCHLFPIRIYPTSEGSYEIIYEEIPECKGGRARGKTSRMPLLDFLESPMVRALGEERVKRLRDALGK